MWEQCLFKKEKGQDKQVKETQEYQGTSYAELESNQSRKEPEPSREGISKKRKLLNTFLNIQRRVYG